MASYTYDKIRATQTAERFNSQSSKKHMVWEFPNAKIWKWFVGTEDEYKRELMSLEKRKLKTKK